MPTGQRPPRDPLTSPLTFRDDLLKDQVVLVSGAGSGIGKAIAIQCARLGARLAICGRKVERLEETAAILRGLGAEVMVRPATIRDAEDVDRLHAEVWERFGRLDHLVNNAGGQFPQAAIDYSVKGWNAVIDTNLNGTWYMMQAAARNWRDRGLPGSIVNIVTVVWYGMPGVAHTCAARAGSSTCRRRSPSNGRRSTSASTASPPAPSPPRAWTSIPRKPGANCRGPTS